MKTGTFNFLASTASPWTWSECSWVMTIADRRRGSSPSAFMRRKVSRQEMPASTKIRVVDVCTRAQFPRLPLASTETDTLIRSEDTLEPCGSGSNSLISRDLRVDGGHLSPTILPTACCSSAPPYDPA